MNAACTPGIATSPSHPTHEFSHIASGPAGCGTGKDGGCIAIRGKRHRAMVRYVGAAFEFRAGSAGDSGGAVCEGGLSIRQFRGPDESVPADQDLSPNVPSTIPAGHGGSVSRSA